jgi:CheY-like chemotaxis protein
MTSPGKQMIILATTASGMAEDKERCLKAGMDDFLEKPIAFEDLTAILVKWML